MKAGSSEKVYDKTSRLRGKTIDVNSLTEDERTQFEEIIGVFISAGRLNSDTPDFIIEIAQLTRGEFTAHDLTEADYMFAKLIMARIATSTKSMKVSEVFSALQPLGDAKKLEGKFIRSHQLKTTVKKGTSLFDFFILLNQHDPTLQLVDYLKGIPVIRADSLAKLTPTVLKGVALEYWRRFGKEEGFKLRVIGPGTTLSIRELLKKLANE
jgi:hypothetical protein